LRPATQVARDHGITDARVRQIRSSAASIQSANGTKRRDQDSKQRAAGRGPEA
jgi:hypothetical protein